MKKAIILAVVGALATPTLAQAGGDTFFGSLGDLALKAQGAMKDTIPSKDMALEADGGNFRMYFFTPPDNQGITCFVAAGTQKGGAACYPKAVK